MTQLQHEHLSNACVLIYANKQDLVRGAAWRAGCLELSSLPASNAAWEGRFKRPTLRLACLPGSAPAPQPQKGAMSVPELSEGLDLISIKSHNWWAARSWLAEGLGVAATPRMGCILLLCHCTVLQHCTLRVCVHTTPWLPHL